MLFSNPFANSNNGGMLAFNNSNGYQTLSRFENKPDISQIKENLHYLNVEKLKNNAGNGECIDIFDFNIQQYF